MPKPAVQIDLVIDRADGMVTICEMKYTKDDYTLTEGEYKKTYPVWRHSRKRQVIKEAFKQV